MSTISTSSEHKFQKIDFYAHYTIKAKLTFLAGSFIVALLLILGYAFNTLQTVKVNGPLYDAIVMDKDLIADILPPPNYIIESYLTAFQLAGEKDPARIKEAVEKFRNLKTGPGGYDERQQYWDEHLPKNTSSLRKIMLEESRKPAIEFFDIVDRELVPAVMAGDTEKAHLIVHQTLKEKYENHRRAIDDAVKLANEDFTEAENRATRVLHWRFMGLGILGLILITGSILFVALPVARNISRPISEGVRIAENIAKGNLAHDVPTLLQARQDEIGNLARAMQGMMENLRRIISDISTGVQTVAFSATSLSAVSAQTANNVQTLSSKTSMVSSAADEARSNTASVASSMENATTDLMSIAAATEEMSSTIGEIASNSEKARAISVEAGKQAVSVSSLMIDLGKAANEINQITETINTISSRTRLLALNATIEAASAGEAGKGFAIVAREIKELASQTDEATDVIKDKIGGVQNSTSNAINDIEKITRVVGEVEQIVMSIAASIEEQAAVTSEVANSISHTTSDVQNANKRMAKTAETSAIMASEVSQIDTAAGEIREGGEQVQSSAVELSKLAEQLKNLMGRFSI